MTRLVSAIGTAIFLNSILFTSVVIGTESQDLDDILLKAIQVSRESGYPDLMEKIRLVVYEKTLGNIRKEYSRDKNLSINGFLISDLIEKLDQVMLFQNHSGSDLFAVAERKTDIYLKSQNVAILNPEYLRASPAARLAILLHIMLGAAGFEDENYQLSLALIFRNESYDGPTRGFDWQLVFPRGDKWLVSDGVLTTQKRMPAGPGGDGRGDGGGGSIVGGGGDFSTVQMKLQLLGQVTMLEDLLASAPEFRRVWNRPELYLSAVLSSEIESSPVLEDILPNQNRILVPKLQESQSDYSEESVKVTLYLLGLMQIKLIANEN